MIFRKNYLKISQNFARSGLNPRCAFQPPCTEGYNEGSLEDIEGRKVTIFRARTTKRIRLAAAEEMKKLMGNPYSWVHVFKAYLYRRIPAFLRPAWMTEELCRGEYHCSQSVSKAFRLAGYDLVPDKPDWATAPADIANSDRVRKIGCLDDLARLRKSNS